MSKVEPSEQVRFLVSCISHSTNGKPDFSAVAADLGIVTKAAAQKRYERMLKAINNSDSPKPASKASDGEEKPAETPTKKRKTAAPAPGSAQKKRGRPPKNKANGDVQPAKAEEENKDSKNDNAADSPLSEAPSTPSPSD